MKLAYDAAVVGSGPNGLAAAVLLAQHGLSVVVIEAEATIGGGARSAELTLPGFVHDVCSAIHPMAIASPFLRTLPMEEHGLEWIHPDAPVGHPLDGQPTVFAERSLEETAAALGEDGRRYERRLRPMVEAAPGLFRDLMGPPQLPHYPLADVRFGWNALRSAWGLSRRWFHTEQARALFAGIAAHSVLPLRQPPSAAVGLMLLLAAHACGWPLPRGGSQKITDALASYLRSLGGEIVTGTRVENIDELDAARVVLLDITPRQVLHMAAHRLPPRYSRALERYRYGPGAFKVDWALDGPIPWNDPAGARAGTMHLGGTLEEITNAESTVWDGRPAERPFVLLAQQSLFDPSRAPPDKHTAWAYCHVPNGSTFDMLPRIETQVERFANGFRDRILARHVFAPADLERHNANYIGGDINGGVLDLRQILARPVPRWRPYRTPARRIYLCSSATPPGGGVHGMCGYFAARTALRDHFA